MLVLLPVILQLIEAGIQIVPQLIAAGKTEVAIINSGTGPTQAQKDELDAALELANNALQNS